jgi:hypothetical protein
MIIGEISFILLIHQIIFIIIGSGINNQYKTLISDNQPEYLTWGNFYSNEFSCLQLDIEDLLNEDYSFNITCSENNTFFHLAKFGISPFDGEGENIANCYAKSYKNLINIDSECDLSEYLEEQLKEFKYFSKDIEISNKKMNIANEILNKCNNKNKRKKFFLTYSCYVSNYKFLGYDANKNSIIIIFLLCELITFTISIQRIIALKAKFTNEFNNNNSIKIKNLTLMIDTINEDIEKMPFFLNDLLILIKKKNK